MIKRILLGLSVLLALAGLPGPLAAAGCTRTVAALTEVDLALTPGQVLCLAAGTYQPGLLALDASGTPALPLTLRAADGARVDWIGTAGNSAASLFAVRGAYWTVAGIHFQAAAVKVPGILIGPAALGFHFAGNEISGGHYNGLDVRAWNVWIDGNQIHNFDSGVAGDDAQCINVLPTAGNVRIIGNDFHDCSGDAIQAFYPNTIAAPSPDLPGGEIAHNTARAGTILYKENFFDLKRGAGWWVHDNDAAGYGYDSIPGTVNNGNPICFVHKWAADVLIERNTFHDSAKGCHIFGGEGLDAGARPVSITLRSNTFTGIAPGYVISNSGGLSVTTLLNAGYDPATPTPTLPPTRTPTAAPSATRTPTPSATVAPVVLTGCWDLRQADPRPIPCP